MLCATVKLLHDHALLCLCLLGPVSSERHLRSDTTADTGAFKFCIFFFSFLHRLSVSLRGHQRRFPILSRIIRQEMRRAIAGQLFLNKDGKYKVAISNEVALGAAPFKMQKPGKWHPYFMFFFGRQGRPCLSRRV